VPIRAVFLDLDDTLCDTIGCRPQRVRAALAHLCARLGRTDLDLDALVARTVDPLERGPAPDQRWNTFVSTGSSATSR
jgi:hypothetical protein